MADILVQFHAAPEELLDFVRTILTDCGLHVVAIRYFPTGAVEVNVDSLDRVFAKTSPYRELVFTIGAPILSAQSGMDFTDMNPSSLHLSIERIGEKGLRQSSLSARTEDATALSTWKNVAKRLKQMTRGGVIVRNPDTGASAQYRSFRYTAGARALASRGVPMLPFAGGNICEFPE